MLIDCRFCVVLQLGNELALICSAWLQYFWLKCALLGLEILLENDGKQKITESFVSCGDCTTHIATRHC